MESMDFVVVAGVLIGFGYLYRQVRTLKKQLAQAGQRTANRERELQSSITQRMAETRALDLMVSILYAHLQGTGHNLKAVLMRGAGGDWKADEMAHWEGLKMEHGIGSDDMTSAAKLMSEAKLALAAEILECMDGRPQPQAA